MQEFPLRTFQRCVRHLVVLLPGREQAEVEQLVRRLNQRQIPIQEAEERFLNGEDLLPVL